MTEWPKLSELEDRIQQAADEIQRLRRHNGELEARLRRLAADETADGGAAAWEQERLELRQRIEQLAGRLEELLEAAPPES